MTGRDADLSANREKFASLIRLPEAYSKMLKEYIDFGCEYRHSPGKSKPRTYPPERDTEAFIYMTGVFLRLAVQTSELSRLLRHRPGQAFPSEYKRRRVAGEVKEKL